MARFLIPTIIAAAFAGAPAVAQTTIIEREAPVVIDRGGPGVVVQQSDPEVTGSIMLSPTDEVIIRRYIVEERVAPAPLRDVVRVGSIIPTSVALTPVEAGLTADVPRLRNYAYFRSPDRKIVFVEPSTRRVVRIVTNQGSSSR